MSLGKMILCRVHWLAVAFAVGACDTADNIAPPDTAYFIKYYGSDGDQEAVDMVVLADASLLVLANATFETATDVTLMRLDPEGAVVWEETLVAGEGADIEAMPDGSFLVLANVPVMVSGVRTGTAPQLFRVSADGQVLQQSAVLGPGGENRKGYTVTPLADGGVMVSGSSDKTNNPTVDRGNLINIKLSPSLTPLADNRWGPVNHGFGQGAQAAERLDVAVRTFQQIIPDGPDADTAPDSIYYVFGHTNSNIGGNNEAGRFGFFYFERQQTGTTGTPRFAGNLEGADTEIQFVDKVGSDLGGGYLVLGTASRGQEAYFFVARLREQLTFAPTDATLYTNIPVARPVKAVGAATATAGERGFLLLANEVRATGEANIWLTKIDQSGAVQWSATYGSENEEDTAAAVAELPDGRIVILGTVGLADNHRKVAVLKTNARGQFLR